jgi:4-amino-4-deoxy-L-arabinose transferase-like glycosyltransferase
MRIQATSKFWGLQDKEWGLLIIILFGVALFRLLIGLWLMPLLDSVPEIASYGVIARNLLAGYGYVMQPGGEPVFHRPPTYTFFLAGLYYLFGDSSVAVTTAHITLDLITCVIIYALANQLFGRPVALLAALGVGFYPLSLYYDTRQLTEPLFTLLLAGLVFLLVKSNESLARKDFFLAGVVWGVGTLCKTSLMYFGLAAMGTTFLTQSHRKRAILPIVIFFIGGILVISPWTVRNYLDSGGHIVPVSTAGPYTYWLGSFYPTLGLDDDGLRGEKLALFEKTRQEIAGNNHWNAPANQATFIRAALENVLSSPLQFMELVARRFVRFWFFIQNPDRQRFMAAIVLVQLCYLVPGMIGVYHALREQQRAIWFLLLPIIYYVVLHSLTLAEVRYSVPVMPYVTIFASYALARLIISLRWTRRRGSKLIGLGGS